MKLDSRVSTEENPVCFYDGMNVPMCHLIQSRPFAAVFWHKVKVKVKVNMHLYSASS